MKAISALIIFILFFKLALSQALAVTVNITSFPSTIGQDGFSLNVSVFGASSGTNYIRVDFYKEGSSNYFGETNNGLDWYSGSDGKQYFPITIQDSKSTASASIQARVGSPNSTDYPGQGAYKMRVRRYTSSGGQGSEDPSLSAVSININLPTNTPTPTLSLTPTPSNTPTPTTKPSSTPTEKITPTISKKLSETPAPTEEAKKSEVLGTETKEDSNKKETIIASVSENNLLPKIFIFLGVIFILACVIVFFYPYIKGLKENKRSEQ